MSFSANVKNEILCFDIENECCRHAFAYGMMLFSRAFSYYDIFLLTERLLKTLNIMNLAITSKSRLLRNIGKK